MKKQPPLQIDKHLDESTASYTQGAVSDEQPPEGMSRAPKAGDRVAHRFELLEWLGSGGFGEVWRARDHQTADRIVAIKILHPWHTQNREAVRRFDREARALAKVKHEHIVALLDGGVCDDRHYLVMEYISGQTLRSCLDERKALGVPPSTTWIRCVFHQICQAMATMHALQDPGPVVHRDLKPDNIMITADSYEQPIVKVLDLGLARLGDREFTQTGSQTGTAAYMAPEQFHGHTKTIGPRTDVFALAVILIELFALEKMPNPTNHWWALAASGSHAIRKALQLLGFRAPESVVNVLVASLSADPSARPSNAGAFYQQFDAAWTATSDLMEPCPSTASSHRRFVSYGMPGRTWRRTTSARRRKINFRRGSAA